MWSTIPTGGRIADFSFLSLHPCPSVKSVVCFPSGRVDHGFHGWSRIWGALNPAKLWRVRLRPELHSEIFRFTEAVVHRAALGAARFRKSTSICGENETQGIRVPSVSICGSPPVADGIGSYIRKAKLWRVRLHFGSPNFLFDRF